MAQPFSGLLLLSTNPALRAYLDLVLSEQGIPLAYFDTAREGLFWLLEHTPRGILVDQDLDLDPFAVAARIKHVRRLKEVPLAVLIPTNEVLKTTAEVVRVQFIEKPLTREKILAFLDAQASQGIG